MIGDFQLDQGVLGITNPQGGLFSSSLRADLPLQHSDRSREHHLLAAGWGWRSRSPPQSPLTPGRGIGLLLALVPYLPLGGLEGQECLVTAPQSVSVDIDGVEG